MKGGITAIRGLDKERWAALAALAILVIVSSLLSPYFLTPRNLLNIMRQVSYTGLIALGMTFVITSGGIDLSVGSLAAFAGAVGIVAMNALGDLGLSPPLGVLGAFLVTVAVAAAGGLFNGLLIAKAGIAPFIVTLGTMAIFRSLSLYMGEAGEFRSNNQLFGDIGSGDILGVPIPVLVLLLAAALLSGLYNRTRYGRYVKAVGSNARVALYSAIDVDRVRLLAYVLVGAMVGVSTILIAMRFNSVGTSTLGVNYELDAIAAVIIGGTAMTGGRGTVWGTIVGALTLGVINNMLNMVGISPYLQGTVKGLVIIGAVFAQRRRN